MEQLHALKLEAAARREARLERQRQEEEELQQILREVEEYEREEARKAELLRLEEVRKEAERWQRELEEKVRLESLRREAVKVKFQELRFILATLDELQEGLAATSAENAVKELDDEKKATLAELAMNHQIERAKIEREATIRIGEERMKWDAEFVARVEMEKTLEEGHEGRLKEHYAGREDALELVEKEMDKYRAKNDGHHEEWQKERDICVEKTEHVANEEKGIKLELLENERRRKEDEFFGREEELEKLAKAGKKWLVAAFAERVRLLDEREHDELENGGEDLSSYITDEDESSFVEEDEGESSIIGVAS
jgi:hypothetical protein